jgi:hypothetical protein
VGLSGCVAADLDPPRSLLSEHIVFRSPFLQSAIAGATCDLVLSQVVQIVENFRSSDAASEFGARIGKWQIKALISSSSVEPAKSSNSRS